MNMASEKSFEVRFDYNPDYVAKVKTIPGAQFEKDKYRWVIPLYSFKAFCTAFTGVQAYGANVIRAAFLGRDANVTAKITKEEAEQFIPDNFIGVLRDYQRIGVLAILKNKNMLLADGVGVGKTFQGIAAICHAPNWIRILVCCPVNLCTQWANVMNAVAPGIKTIIPATVDDIPIPSSIKEKTVIFFNYEKLLAGKEKDAKYGAFFLRLASIEWDVLFGDEIQRIKNWRAKRTRLLKLIKAKRRYGFTGTPIENKLEDLYSIINFIDPGFFGSWQHFEAEFIQRDHFGGISSYKNLPKIKAMLPGIMLRRRKQDVLKSMPPIVVKNYYIERNAGEKRLQAVIDEQMELEALNYRKQMAIAARGEKSEANTSHMNLLAWLTMSRLLCDSAALLEISESNIAIEHLNSLAAGISSSKLKELEEVVPEMVSDDEKVVVFTTFKEMGAIIENRFNELGYNPAFYHGELSSKKKDEQKMKFITDKSCKMIIGTEAMSEGVDGLQEVSSQMVAYDLWWNPARFEQKVGRLHRSGQDSSVTVINLLVKDSIDEKIYKLLVKKQALADSALGDPKSTLGGGTLIERKSEEDELLQEMGLI